MRLHSVLLHLYPSSFRAEYGEELSYAFSQRRRNVTNPLSIALLWLVEFFDVLVNAARVHWDILRQDLRYTARTLARTPGFTLTAIVVTGLGIGANTAVFSIADHVLLHPLPFADSDRLIQLWQRQPAYPRLELSPPNFHDWRRLSTSFEAMSAYTRGMSRNFLGQGEPRRLDGTAVTPEFFPILGVQPALGRVFTDADVRQDAPGTVILSHALWQSAFGGVPDVLGKSIRLDTDSFTVIGIMPEDFFFPARGTQMWIPFDVSETNQARDNYYLNAMGRLKPGVNIEKARAEMAVITDQLARQYPKENDKTSAFLDPLADQVSSQTRLLIWTLFGASFCVLLIACTNLANLLLVRAMGRRKELSVRAAIGAGRERLVRQLLTESVLLACAGGALGVLIAVMALPLLSLLVPQTLPIGDATVLDPRVFAFAAMVTLATGLGFGVLPALRMCRDTGNEGLREGSRGGVGGRREKLRSALVVAEITVSVVLLIAAGLLIRALWRVQSTDPGFRPDAVLAMQTSLPLPRYAVSATRTAFYEEVLSKVRALPGVSKAGFVSALPMATGAGGIWPVAVPGVDEAMTVSMKMVTPGFFEALGIPLRAGRDINASDTLNASPAVVVSESFVRRYWPTQDPLGRHFHFAMTGFPFALQDRTIVGVVGDVRFRGLERESEPQVYLAYSQVPDNSMTFYSPKELVVRSTTDNAILVPSLRSIIQKADPELPIAAVRTLRDVVDLQTAPRSTQIRLVASFAALALLLAGIGIHGVLSFAVGQRAPEFGLRIALGAQSRDILSMVLGEGLVLAGLGTIFGLILSYFAGRSMEALLAGVAPHDPATLVIAGLGAFAMTLSGSLLPALRAMRVDPTTVIRGE